MLTFNAILTNNAEVASLTEMGSKLQRISDPFSINFTLKVSTEKKVKHWSYLIVAADALLRQRVNGLVLVASFYLISIPPLLKEECRGKHY